MFCARMQALGKPVISIDTKNAGTEWHPKGKAPAVLTYDFPKGVMFESRCGCAAGFCD